MENQSILVLAIVVLFVVAALACDSAFASYTVHTTGTLSQAHSNLSVTTVGNQPLFPRGMYFGSAEMTGPGSKVDIYTIHEASIGGYTDWADLATFADRWLDNCCSVDGWCGRADLNRDSNVDFADFALLAKHWLDVTPGTDPYEPDDTDSQANWIGRQQTHSIIPADDVDWLKFLLSTESEVVIETSGSAGDDTYMWLLDSNINVIGEDDDSGSGYFSRIDCLCGLDPLPAGTYYVAVTAYDYDDEIPSYDITLTVTACVAPELDDPLPIYRFWSPVLKTHFWTISESEKGTFIDDYRDVWEFQGIAYYAYPEGEQSAEASPVYRFWSPVREKYFWTISESEKDKLINLYPHVWTYEGIAFYVYAWGQQPVDASPVYRFWSPVFTTHFFTISESEKECIIANLSDVWTYEDLGWYAFE